MFSYLFALCIHTYFPTIPFMVNDLEMRNDVITLKEEEKKSPQRGSNRRD